MAQSFFVILVLASYMATVVIGGLISSTALTLVLLPALYRLCHRIESTTKKAIRN